MGRSFGTRAEDLHAAIGPGIGKCCYQVGADVAAKFPGQGSDHVDLTAANRQQLQDAGVTAARIYASNLCTMCRAAEFYSFRRDRDAAGRMFSFAGIR
jgi:copper oxidase (laccase) domain-containing protein